MNRIILALFCYCISTLVSNAQIVWHNPISESGISSYVHNRGWNEAGMNYNRLPLRAKAEVRPAVWNLACESAGLSICFSTDAQHIQIRYQATGGYSMPHMPATGVSGVDLYVWDGDKPRICFTEYAFADTIHYDYTVDRVAAGKHTYQLFLPLYNGVKWLEVGVDANAAFEFIPAKMSQPIVVYGTSIAQGACASRPGMAWTNILSRRMREPVVNLGFSGNGKLEKEMLSLLLELDAKIYVIDCMANLYDKTSLEVRDLVTAAVKQIRAAKSTPILLVEHAGYSNAGTNDYWNTGYSNTNKGLQMAYKQLTEDNCENLFYLSNEELGYNPDSWVDYVHPSDYGMVQQADAVENKIKSITRTEN